MPEGAGPTRPGIAAPGDRGSNLHARPGHPTATSSTVALSAVWAKVSPKAALERTTDPRWPAPQLQREVSGSGRKVPDPSSTDGQEPKRHHVDWESGEAANFNSQGARLYSIERYPIAPGWIGRRHQLDFDRR